MRTTIRTRWLTTSLVVAAACASCRPSDVGAPRALPSATFQLVSIDAKSLPDTVLELPTRTGGRSGCFQIATRGFLVLDDAKHSFLISRHFDSNCGTGFGSDTTAVGDYRLQGDSLRLMVFNGTDSLKFPASFTATHIVIDDVAVHWRYVFAR